MFDITVSSGVSPHFCWPEAASSASWPGSKVCGCLTATYIGGSANLAEVAFDSGLAKEGGGILACLAAADVLLMCFYFAGLVLVPGSIAV